MTTSFYLLCFHVYQNSFLSFFLSLFSKAAVLIQSQWRSYIARRQVDFSAKMNPTTAEPLHNPFSNNGTTSNKERRKNMNVQEEREKAAFHIQVNFKLLIAELVIKNILLIFHSSAIPYF